MQLLQTRKKTFSNFQGWPDRSYTAFVFRSDIYGESIVFRWVENESYAAQSSEFSQQSHLADDRFPCKWLDRNLVLFRLRKNLYQFKWVECATQNYLKDKRLRYPKNNADSNQSYMAVDSFVLHAELASNTVHVH